MRTFTDEESKYDALFCKSNREKDNNGKYKFIHIIEKVYEEAEKCSASLKTFNQRICLIKNWKDPYLFDNEREKYLKSNYVANLKKRESTPTQKYFHGERFLNTHIGYIDRFRYYLLNYCSDISEEEKPVINKQIVELLKKYTNLLSNVLTIPNGYIQRALLPHYKSQIQKIIEKEYQDFSIEINN